MPRGGTPVLPVKLTPTDTAHYPTATAIVSITVNRAVLTVTAGNATRLVNSPNRAFTASVTGLTAGAFNGTITVTANGTTSSVPAAHPSTRHTVTFEKLSRSLSSYW